jgi:two-component system sensor histidine kinase DesK
MSGLDHFVSGKPLRWQAVSGSIYALFVLVVPLMSRANWRVWVATFVSFVVFAALYVDFLSQLSKSTRRAGVDLVLIGLLGFALVPFNTGATTYVVYAAALTPFVLSAIPSLVIFVLLAAAVFGEMLLLADPNRFVIGGWMSLVILIVGCGNLFLGERIRHNALIRRAQEDVEEMAKVAERERIARDLHDLLGHTLSVIALKSELASKLADRDPARAADEIREVERVSREALAEVRAAVEGYKGRGFSGELRSAEQVLGSAGVRLDADITPVPLSPRQETVLALALRETVTNVVRHARASVCRVALGLDAGDLVLTIQDDGIGGPLREGNGLVGMRDRVAAAGGTLDVIAQKGVRVCVRFPAARAMA